jgi:hypothetical protein
MIDVRKEYVPIAVNKKVSTGCIIAQPGMKVLKRNGMDIVN